MVDKLAKQNKLLETQHLAQFILYHTVSQQYLYLNVQPF